MRRRSVTLYNAPGLIWLGAIMLAAAVARADEHTGIWSIPYPERFDQARLVRSQSWISVDGNGFVEDDGTPFVFRGVSIADPHKVLEDGKWHFELFQEISDWGANTIRLPIHPIAWRELGEERYFALIDDAVVWANRLDMYLIVDWHSIGYLPTEQFQHPVYDTTRKETLAFWRAVAFRYKYVPTVAVYELFNEPTTQGNTLGIRDWSEWKLFNEYLIDMIHAQHDAAIPLVAGFDWAYDLRPVRSEPIDRSGVAYSVHPYPQKAGLGQLQSHELIARWDEAWGFVSERYPMIATEIGWVREGGYGAHRPVINDGSYGPIIIDYLQQRGISWIAWVFDPEWSPVLITDWDYTPSEQGRFFREALNDSR